MILCSGVLCVAVLVPVVGRKKVSSEVRRAAVVMILVSALAISTNFRRNGKRWNRIRTCAPIIWGRGL